MEGREGDHSGGNSDDKGEAALMFVLLKDCWGLPRHPVVKTRHFQSRGYGFDPCWGTEILPATWHSQKLKKKIKRRKKKIAVCRLQCTGNKYDG